MKDLTAFLQTATAEAIARMEIHYTFLDNTPNAQLCRDHGLARFGADYCDHLATPFVLIQAFGKTEPYFPAGKGAYPYDCRSKNLHPDSMVYVSASGCWIPDHALTRIDDNTLRLV